MLASHGGSVEIRVAEGVEGRYLASGVDRFSRGPPLQFVERSESPGSSN